MLGGNVGLPSTAKGACVFNGGGATGQGYGIGIGNGAFETAGVGYLMALYENVRWINTGRIVHSQWNHFVLVLNASGHPAVYHDGDLVYSDASGAPNAPAESLKIWGYFAGAARYFTGTMDEVAIYGTALSAARVRAHFEAGAPYRAAVLSDRPVAYWQLDEGSGTIMSDQSENALTGTYSGTMTMTRPSLVVGGLGIPRAIQFDGASGGGSVPDNALFNLTSFTLEAWLSTANAGSGRRRIISQQGAEGYWIMALTDNQLECGSSIDGVLTSAAGLLNTDPAPHHVAIVRDVAGGAIRWYVDGVQTGVVAISTGAAGYAITANVEIARYSGGTEHFAGTLDEIAVYPTALPASRIAYHCRAGRHTLLQRWNGSAWGGPGLLRWSGSAWVRPAAVKRWDGAKWVAF